MTYVRPQAAVLTSRLAEPPRHIHILAGPRQVGKSTLIRQVMHTRPVGSYLMLDAEARSPSQEEPGARWITEQWNAAEAGATSWRESGHSLSKTLPYVLVLDEIQHIEQWSTAIKGAWDAGKARGSDIHLILLGSAPLLVQQGLNESLTGRYELLRMPHWSFPEMTECFGLSLDQFIYFGGYPGSAPLIGDEERWRGYVRGSLIEPSIERDVLAMARVDAPATLRRLFELGCEYSAQILALNRVSQTLGAGHVLTLAHYLSLLNHAGLLVGLHKYSHQTIRQRQSPPKFQVLNNALFSAQGTHGFAEALADRSRWGRLVESTIGTHLLNSADQDTKIHYWRDSSLEVDFVIEHRGRLAAIEVKSAGVTGRLHGLDEFCKRHPEARRFVVGSDALPIGEFLMQPATAWVA
ncbi:ATP-binding protein [soil metagenome]